MKRVLLLLLLSCPASAFAASCDVAIRVDWVERRQNCFLGRCTWMDVKVSVARGSGVIVASNRSSVAVLSCYHVMRPGPREQRAKPFVWFFIDGQWRKGEPLGSDSSVDLSLWSVAYTGSNAKPTKTATEIKDREPVRSRAYVGGMKFREQAGTLYLRNPSDGATSRSSIFTSMTYQDGESGGGIFNSKGELVSILYGFESDPRTRQPTYGKGVHLREVRAFMGKHIEMAANTTPTRPRTTPQRERTQPKDQVARDGIKRIDGLLVEMQKSVDGLEQLVEKERLARNAQLKDQQKFQMATDDTLKQTESRLESVLSVVETIRDTRSSPTSSGFGTFLTWLGTAAGMSAAGATGVGIAVPIAIALYRRRKKRKRGEEHREPPRAVDLPPEEEHLLGRILQRLQALEGRGPQAVEKPVPVSIDTPPSVQVDRETHYVPVEQDAYREATAYAHRELVRKYPGALGTVEFIDSVVDQVLSGRGQPTTAETKGD